MNHQGHNNIRTGILWVQRSHSTSTCTATFCVIESRTHQKFESFKKNPQRRNSNSNLLINSKNHRNRSNLFWREQYMSRECVITLVVHVVRVFKCRGKRTDDIPHKKKTCCSKPLNITQNKSLNQTKHRTPTSNTAKKNLQCCFRKPNIPRQTTRYHEDNATHTTHILQKKATTYHKQTKTNQSNTTKKRKHAAAQNHNIPQKTKTYHSILACRGFSSMF